MKIHDEIYFGGRFYGLEVDPKSTEARFQMGYHDKSGKWVDIINDALDIEDMKRMVEAMEYAIRFKRAKTKKARKAIYLG